MANIALTDAGVVSIVQSIEQDTQVAGEAITPGAPVRYDTSGNFVNGNGTTATEASVYGIATGKRSIPAGMPVTAIKKGVVDGFVFVSGQDFSENVFVSDTDARLGDAAGTVSVIVGKIIPGAAGVLGAAKDKLLEVNL